MVSMDLSTRVCDGQAVVVLRGGIAALVRGRKQARHAEGDLLLAAPQQQVLRPLALTRLIDVFSIHASVDEAAESTGHSRLKTAPAGGTPALLGVT